MEVLARGAEFEAAVAAKESAERGVVLINRHIVMSVACNESTNVRVIF